MSDYERDDADDQYDAEAEAEALRREEQAQNGGSGSQQHDGDNGSGGSSSGGLQGQQTSPEEDSGRGEQREYHDRERGGEAAYDDPNRDMPALQGASSSSYTPRSASLHVAPAPMPSVALSEFDPSKVYVENLPLPISETQLRDLFQQFGGITRIHIGTDRLTKAQLGFGFVEFAQDQQGLNAIAAMHQREVNGRVIRCSQAKRRPAPNAPPSAAARSQQQPVMAAAASVNAYGMPAGTDMSGMAQSPYMMMNPAMMGGMAMTPAQQMQMQMAGGAGGMMMQTPMGMQPMGYAAGAMINPATGMMMVPPAAVAPAATVPAAAPASAQPAYGRNDAPASPNIFINGIPFAYTENDLQSLFEAFGTILSTKILLDLSGKSKGQGFVHFEKQISAQASIQAWNGKKPPNGETYLQVRYALPRKTGGAASAAAPAAAVPVVQQQQPQMMMAGPMMMMGGMPMVGGADGFAQQFDPSQQQMMPGSDPSAALPFAPSRVVGALGVGAGSDSGYGPDRKGRGHLGQKHDPLARPAPSTAATGASNLSAVYGGAAVAAGAASLVANGPDSTTLFIYHVPKGLTNDELQTLFSQHGGVISVSIPRDSNNENKGFAFAKMQTMADAHNAMNALQGHEIQGKRLKVSFKTERRAETGIVLPPGSVASNTAALIAQAQAQAQQQQQQAAAAAQQQQMMMMNPMMGGMMYNPAMMMGGGAMTPQQQQQMQMMQMQQMQQMGQMQPGGGVGGGAMQAGMMQPMMQPMMGGYGMQAGMMAPAGGVGVGVGGQPGQPGGMPMQGQPGAYGMYPGMMMQPQQQQQQQQPGQWQ